jgi:hypothetical protein
MLSKIFIALISSSSILSCVNQNEKATMENKIVFQLNVDSISHIKVLKEEQEFEIRSRNEIDLWIKAINNSQVDYIKFGSKNKFCIYDLANNIVLEGFFRGNKFKVKGVAYKCDNNLLFILFQGLFFIH